MAYCVCVENFLICRVFPVVNFLLDGRIVDFWVDESGSSVLFSCIQSGLQSTLVVTTESPRPKLLKEFKSTIITSAGVRNETIIIYYKVPYNYR